MARKIQVKVVTTTLVTIESREEAAIEYFKALGLKSALKCERAYEELDSIEFLTSPGCLEDVKAALAAAFGTPVRRRSQDSRDRYSGFTYYTVSRDGKRAIHFDHTPAHKAYGEQWPEFGRLILSNNLNG